MANKRKLAADQPSDEEHDAADQTTSPAESPDALQGETLGAERKAVKLFKAAKDDSQRLIVVLENANLDVVKLDGEFHLLNCDEHMNLIRKNKKDPAFCRPDILHQCLLMLLDSPLNRAGQLQVYIHSQQNVLIQVNPQVRIPRTFARFSGLMVQLLHKMSIKAVGSSVPLLKVIKNPISSHLPFCKKVLMSYQAPKLSKPRELVPADKSPLVVVIGAMAHGQVNPDYTEETVSISQYPLSAALACTKVVSAFEEAWEIH